MNIIITNGREIRLESYWRSTKDDISKDSHGVEYPYPSNKEEIWPGLEQFVAKLTATEESLNHRFQKYKKTKRCLLCDKKDVTIGRYMYHKIIWEDGLKHYITVHNIKPSPEFMDIIYRYKEVVLNRTGALRFNGNIKNINNTTYVKIHKNQLLILDALMKHGGYAKKYADIKNSETYRYSEHAGLLDFNNVSIEKIIVAGNTTRIDRGDEEIYLPRNIPDALEYEYIFHTHPPTPKPGGRSSNGILYEFPSIGDILHFIDHFNDGKTCGSLVVTSEGLYNIRRTDFNTDKLDVDEDSMFHEYNSEMKKIQKHWIAKYGTTFDTYIFYSTIAQNILPIKELNTVLNKFNISIDFYPRIRDKKGNWIIDTVYLPVYKR
jgi:hypothetical protein